MNSFYNQHKLVQWLLALIILIVGFFPMIKIVEWASDEPLFYLLFFVFIPIAQFSATPIFRLTGVYKYYSPMLLGYMANKQQIDLHSGGSFDYLFVLRKFRKGAEIRNEILKYQLEGLLRIITKIEQGEIPPTVNIVGTSYFFSERTLNKLGFEPKKPSLFYRINLCVNFIDLFWMYSLSRGKLTIPRVWKALKTYASGEDLLSARQKISELYHKLYS
jgi:hypothetical protein